MELDRAMDSALVCGASGHADASPASRSSGGGYPDRSLARPRTVLSC